MDAVGCSLKIQEYLMNCIRSGEANKIEPTSRLKEGGQFKSLHKSGLNGLENVLILL